MTGIERFRDQHKKRLSWMPWLYFSLKPRHREWAEAWQQEVQRFLLEQDGEREARAVVDPYAD